MVGREMIRAALGGGAEAVRVELDSSPRTCAKP